MAPAKQLPGLAAAALSAFTFAAAAVQPGHESARANAHGIFNAVHSAARQWGSSVHHNGLGFLPVVMPKGTVLYHGSQSAAAPPGVEWLALEVEHAEAFAVSRPLRRHYRGPAAPPPQKPLADESPNGQNRRGYLHTYRAHRDLNLLYLDGMSAAKTRMGTLDTQDLVLRENHTDSTMDELARASEICGLMTQWGYDGFMRMEIGFEVVYCDFSVGIDPVAVTRSLLLRDEVPIADFNLYQWARAVAERYDGVGGERVRIDFSSMVSGFFFPVNLSNTDPERPDLPRFAAATLNELKDIKAHVRHVGTEARRFAVNWQAVVDMIVTRYSNRLAVMASPQLSSFKFIDELEIASMTYFDAPPLPGDVTVSEDPERNRTAEAIDACIQHYLLPTHLARGDWSLHDKLIHTAIVTVMSGVCNTLFVMRSVLLQASPNATNHDSHIPKDGDKEKLDKAVEASRGLLHRLREELAWTTWKRPQVCPVDKMLFMVMWPFGEPEDYWDPGCRSIDEIVPTRRGYWSPYDELSSAS